MFSEEVVLLEAVFLFGFLIAMALVIARMRDLFAAAMLTGIFSLIAAGLYTVMDAVDVAFTEAAVGAGISTVLILGTLALTEKRERQSPGIRWRALLVCFLTGAVLIYGTMDMPHYGNPDAPIHNHLSNRYIEGAHNKDKHPEYSVDGKDYRGEINLQNIVTAVLGSYRGYDTFGETTVILTAGLGVMLLMLCRTGRKRHEKS